MSSCGSSQSPAPAPNPGGSNSGGGNQGGGGGGGTGGGGGGGGGGGNPPPGPTDITAINHIIFMFQENRSFDHYFGHLNTYRKAVLGSAVTDTVNTLDALSTPATNPADTSAPLSWTSSNATTVKINGAPAAASGNMSVTPGTATLYTAVATSSTGLTAQASVVVGTTPDNSAPRILVGASPMNVQPGQQSLLTWATTDSSSVNISPAPDPLHTQAYGPNASATVTAPATPGSVTYMLTSSSGLSASITLTVTAMAAGAPTIRITHNNQGHVSLDGSATVSSFLLTDQCVEDFSPDWLESHGAYNRDDPSSNVWLNNGFVHITAGFSQYANSQNDHHHYFDVRGERNMGYYDEKTLPLYYFLATQFGTSDNFFSPIPSNSGPNRVAELAATTAGHAHNPPTLDVKNIFQLVDNAGVSWKVYYSDAGPNNTPLTTLTNFVWGQQHADAKHVAPVDCTNPKTPCAAGQTDYFTDLQSGNFPAVALIEPGFNSGRDEHPGNPVQVGAVYISTLMSKFMSSPIWKDSVFFLTYDEAGGFYDHVQPMINAAQPDGIPPMDLLPKDPAGDFTRTGFRLPLMVVSAYVKPHVVSHAASDGTAILKFIEERFNLPNLTKRDAAQPDFAKEFFDFTKASTPTAPTLPNQPGDANCAAYAKNP
ncbi:MAG TPA: alkaline phosphatase family protein [Terriglobales bacterium]|nr:alkaline phosphatase family protein [Terriglobales bacterium]